MYVPTRYWRQLLGGCSNGRNRLVVSFCCRPLCTDQQCVLGEFRPSRAPHRQHIACAWVRTRHVTAVYITPQTLHILHLLPYLLASLLTYLLTDLLTYLLHGADSFLRSQLVLQLIKKFPAFCGTRKFITVLTSARHLSLS